MFVSLSDALRDNYWQPENPALSRVWNALLTASSQTCLICCGLWLLSVSLCGVQYRLSVVTACAECQCESGDETEIRWHFAPWSGAANSASICPSFSVLSIKITGCSFLPFRDLSVYFFSVRTTDAVLFSFPLWVIHEEGTFWHFWDLTYHLPSEVHHCNFLSCCSKWANHMYCKHLKIMIFIDPSKEDK